MSRFSIYLRVPNDDGTADYRMVSDVDKIRFVVPPLIGDQIEIQPGPEWIAVKVIKRRWIYPVYGSAAWPYDSPSDFVPEASLDIIVEQTEELFSDEREQPT
jgi:hypothetical protein